MGSEPFARSWLEQHGFEGFRPFAELPVSDVPAAPGMYVVLRPSAEPPQFLERNPASLLRGRPNTVDVGELERRWVPDASVVYIGKAGPSKQRTLARRLDEFRRFGAGQDNVAHRGGRLIWQLADSHELLVAWRVHRHHPACEESRLVGEFRRFYGAAPLANMAPTLRECPTGDCDLAVGSLQAVPGGLRPRFQSRRVRLGPATHPPHRRSGLPDFARDRQQGDQPGAAQRRGRSGAGPAVDRGCCTNPIQFMGGAWFMAPTTASRGATTTQDVLVGARADRLHQWLPGLRSWTPSAVSHSGGIPSSARCGLAMSLANPAERAAAPANT